MNTTELIKQLRDFRTANENWTNLKALMEAAADKIEELENDVEKLQIEISCADVSSWYTPFN